MKDRVTFGIMGFLVAIIMMQAGVISQRSDNVMTVPAAMAGVVTDGPGIVSWRKADAPYYTAVALDELGQAWIGGPFTGWQQAGGPPIPVPIGEIKFWSYDVLLTNDNVLWSFNAQGEDWVNHGPWPGGGVPTNESTWGGTKNQFKGND